MDWSNELELLASSKSDIPSWSTLGDAMTIVSEEFGSNAVGNGHGGKAGYDYCRIHVSECADLVQRERRAKGRLDTLGWHLFTVFLLDSTRFKRMGTGDITTYPYNVYGLVPFSDIAVTSPLTTVYHATEIGNRDNIKNEGLKPSSKTDYVDAEGKLHVCLTLDGDEKAAANWVKLLSNNKSLAQSDYMILQVNLEGVSARMYHDLHGLSESGIVIDQFSAIPPDKIADEFRLLNGQWTKQE
jgi:hypothetical protein